MYLRRIRYPDGYHYVIRETYREEGSWKFRDIMDLGANPADHIEYPGGNGFYFNPEIEETLDAMEVQYTSSELEDLFLPFIKPHIRYVIESFRHTYRPAHPSSACSTEELWEHERSLHSFDKRRLHYLRFGRIDIGNLDGRSWKFLNVLLCKSRDEIESTIEHMEMQLKPKEFAPYIYTALNLQGCFPRHIMRNYPIALDIDEVDACFMDKICSLNRDASFFEGMEEPRNGKLHPFLLKYVILFFDSTFEPDLPWQAFMDEFRYRSQFRRRTLSERQMSDREAYVVFGISREQFTKMSRKELVRIYRRRAKKMHPDKGGDQKEFVRLTEAYESLMAKK